MHSKKGFTLIELMVVVVIVGICIFNIGIPILKIAINKSSPQTASDPNCAKGDHNYGKWTTTNRVSTSACFGCDDEKVLSNDW